jgi:hypothetical protein
MMKSQEPRNKGGMGTAASQVMLSDSGLREKGRALQSRTHSGGLLASCSVFSSAKGTLPCPDMAWGYCKLDAIRSGALAKVQMFHKRTTNCFGRSLAAVLGYLRVGRG